MDGVMIRLAEDHFWYVHANGEFESWLTAFSNGLEVSINDPQSRVLQVQGPRSLVDIKRLWMQRRILINLATFMSAILILAVNRFW